MARNQNSFFRSSVVKPNRVKTGLRQDASGGPPPQPSACVRRRPIPLKSSKNWFQPARKRPYFGTMFCRISRSLTITFYKASHAPSWCNGAIKAASLRSGEWCFLSKSDSGFSALRMTAYIPGTLLCIFDCTYNLSASCVVPAGVRMWRLSYAVRWHGNALPASLTALQCTGVCSISCVVIL